MPVEISPANNLNPAADLMFKRIVVVSTAIGFAIGLGTAACLQRGAEHGFELRWHWRALIWMALGAWAAFHLWHLVWSTQTDPTPQARFRLKRFCVVILLATAAVFVYPITFVSSEHFSEVLTGLSLATAVLTFVGWMISRVVRGFNEEDAASPPFNDGDKPI